MTTLVDLLFKANTSELDKAQDKLKQVGSESKKVQDGAGGVDGAFSKMGGGVKLAAAGVAAFATAAAAAYAVLSDLAHQAIETADSFNDLSNRTNISTERLSLYDAMAKTAGVSVDELVQSSEKLASKFAKQDENTGRAVLALKSLGISTKDASGELKSMLQLQEEIVMATVNATDKAQAESAALQLLGTDFYKLRTAIKEAKEQKSEMYDYMLKTNALISGSLAKSSDEYNDKVAKLGLAFKGIGNSIAEVSLPYMIKFQSKMIEIAEYAANVIRRFAGLTTASEETGEALGKLMVERQNQLNAIAKMEQSALHTEGGDSAALKAAREKVTVINDQIREMQRLKSGADAAAASVKAAVTDGKKDEGQKVTGKESTPKGKDPHLDYLEVLKKQQEANAEYWKGVEELDKAQAKYAADLQKVIDAEDDKVAASNRSVKEYFIQLDVMKKYGATTYDVNRALRENEIAETAAALAIAKARNESSDEVKILEKKLDTLRKINMNETAKDGADKAEAERQRSFSYGWEQAFGKYKDDASNTAKTVGEMFNTVTSNMSDALANFAMTGKFAFSDFARSVIADLIRIATQKAAAGIVGALFGGGGSVGTASTGAEMSAAAGMPAGTFANGAAFNNGVQFFANGGVVNRATAFGMSGGQSGVMGEAGPEAIMPLGRGADGKMGVRAIGGGSSNQFTVIVNVEGGKDANETGNIVSAKVLKLMQDVADGRIMNAKRNGGMLAA